MLIWSAQRMYAAILDAAEAQFGNVDLVTGRGEGEGTKGQDGHDEPQIRKKITR